MNLRAFLCVTAFAICCSPHLSSGQSAHLILNPDPGELITGGKSYDITYTPQNTNQFITSVEGLTNGLPSFAQFNFITGLNPPPGAFLDFATNQLGMPLLPGTYTDAQRAPFADLGHPGLDVGFDSHGGGTITGDFTIMNAVFAPDPKTASGWKIVQFDATFNQRVDNETPVLHGSFSYSLVGVPEPSTLALLGFGGFAFLAYASGVGRASRRDD